jgi:tryptophan synthase alpha chain
LTSLSECFQKTPPYKKFVPYLSLGDPTFELSVEWALSIIEGGADILELGIPFSDPTADGPVIQASYKRALSNGFTMEKVLQTTEKIHTKYPLIPIVYLSYFNPIQHYGLENFFRSAHRVGLRGIVIPDVPFDSKESETVCQIANANLIDIIYLVTPATTEQRIKKMKKYASGFIYYVTSFGVTGERSGFADNLNQRIQTVKDLMGLPVCAGFGISRPEQARSISEVADGIIIGSAIQKIIETHSVNPDGCNKKLKHYIKEIRNSLK